MPGKLGNTDIRDLYLLNAPAKLSLAALAAACVLLAAYFLFFRGQLDTWTQQQAEETELKHIYTQKSNAAANLNNLHSELDSIRSAFDGLLGQLPTDAEIPTLIQELHHAASANGLRLDSVQPGSPLIDGPMQKLPYEIAVTGTYTQISRFVRNVGELSRIITLESVRISQAADAQQPSENSGLLTLSATAATYKARAPEEIAAETATDKAASNPVPDNE